MARTKINPKQIRPGADNQVLKTVGGKAVWGEAENTGSVLTPVLPLPIYGMVRGRVGDGAQVVDSGQTVSVLWDNNRKLEQNIRFLGEGAGENAFEIPEDGIYTFNASLETVDVSVPFGLIVEKKDTSGNWTWITPTDYVSYPKTGRGNNVSTTQHFRKGEMVRLLVEVAIQENTRLGEHEYGGRSQVYMTITRVATFGMDTQVSAQSHNQLFKKINARVNLSGGANNTIKFSFDVPTEFRGRKFKATFKLIYDYRDLNGTDKQRAVTEVYRKDWNGTSYLVDRLLFRKHSDGYHNYFELTEIYENTSTLQVMDLFLRDRDNVSPTQAGSTESAVLLETID